MAEMLRQSLKNERFDRLLIGRPKITNHNSDLIT
jgi:hypothetical protein